MPRKHSGATGQWTYQVAGDAVILVELDIEVCKFAVCTEFCRSTVAPGHGVLAQLILLAVDGPADPRHVISPDRLLAYRDPEVVYHLPATNRHLLLPVTMRRRSG